MTFGLEIFTRLVTRPRFQAQKKKKSYKHVRS